MAVKEKKKEEKMVEFSVKKKIEIHEFAKDAFASFPEYAVYCFTCEGYDYNNMSFIFRDNEEDKRYELNRHQIEMGVIKFIKHILDGGSPGIGFNEPEDVFDLCNWDAYSTDGCLQMCIFGEVIYG